ncbi:transglycosylase SLT domain-containing protein [Ferrimonas marina]|uniref:Soluble lytic murein transglycosylase n=1 Tax=Ferrimonas marina TaxID=299255 RepID=A0A1M5R712_9GAMM|nr:transglycosylase SLT domain-containing protein [Ferrimonas marina]SHH21850.1 soluble lytic murein transglycosylase [Ferrimonas marina]
MAWGRTVSRLLAAIAALTTVQLAASEVDGQLKAQREQYQQARTALKQGKLPSYRTLRQQLDDYPLAPYLDYHYERAKLPHVSPEHAQQVLDALAQTPLQTQYKHYYLLARGQRRDWPEFLAISPEPPRSEALRCYYYRAQLSQGQDSLAWQGAEELWLTGKSRDKACDPLFKAWHKAGGRDDEMIWQRMILAHEARQGKLLRYLNSLLSERYRAQGDLLLRLYSHPHELRHRAPYTRSDAGRQIAALTIGRQARKSPRKAWKQWQAWDEDLGPYQTDAAHSLIYYSLLDNEWNPGLEKLLAQFPRDDLLVLRIRRAIFQADWHGSQRWLQDLTQTTQSKSEWQFWLGYSAQKLGDEQQAKGYWQPLAQNRNFYGFLAAQQLGMPYSLQNQLPEFTSQDRSTVSQLPATARLAELMWLEKTRDARAEIRWQMPQLSRPQQAALLEYTHQQQWAFLTVEGTIQAKMWDALPWRFPPAYQEHFAQYAEMRELDEALLQAVARRESALYPRARSSANAYGLMQLLPSTAKGTARKIGAAYRGQQDLYQPRRNIQLGSAYLQQLYTQYEGNRLLASAAYNAGPHRVSRWLKRSDGELDAPRFIATIPFRETREYVEAILSYQLIYASLDDRALPLMTESEQQRRY